MVLCAAVVCPMTMSCETHEPYDDSELRNQIDMLINKMYELENKMNTEIDALKALLNGKLLISDISTNTQTGVTTVTLSNGKELQLLPKTDLKSFVTYITSGGIDYWAYVDDAGAKQYFLNEKGEAIPVVSEMPEVITRDEEIFLVIGGQEYPLSGNSVFSDYELIKDELTGDVYAVTFTFGEGMSFTVTVDGAAGFMFVRNDAWSQVAISEQYIPEGMTSQVQYQAYGVVDYVLQIPDGWRVKAYEDPYLGTGFTVTAPATEHIASGIAAGEGELKVIAVLQGGKATVAKLDLTTKAFKEFGVSYGKATIKVNNGLYKYAYGVCAASSFDKDAIFAKAVENLNVYDYPAGYGMTFYDLVDEPLSNVMQADLVPGNSYVFWALPAIYDDKTDSYCLKENTFVTETFNYTTVKLDVVNQSIRDAKIDIEVSGAEGYYFGISPKDQFFAEDLIHYLNIPDYYTPKTEMIYSGSVFELAGVASEAGTEYVAWIVVAEEGKTYTAADLVTCEFATEDLQPGSTVKVTAEVTETAMDVVAHLAAAGGEKIYYSFIPASDASRYADDAARAAYLFEKGMYASAEGVDAKASDFIQKLKPETSVVLFALATDNGGKYSEVLVRECATTPLQYNDIKVAVEVDVNTPEEVKLKVSAAGGNVVEYLYWIGKTSDNTWKSTNYLGGNAESAQKYMYLNATASRFTDIANKYPVEEGMITISDHTPGFEYVIVIMAKDASGLYSKAVELKFVAHSVNIGKIVMKTDSNYSKAEPTVTWLKEYFRPAFAMMNGSYAFDVVIPEGFTAYVLAGTDNYLTDGDESATLTAEEKILKIISLVDKGRDAERDLDGLGSQHYHFEHGDPGNGNAVIWANGDFHNRKCDCGGNHEEEGKRYGEMTTIYHRIHLNDGTPIRFSQPYAIGNPNEVVDRVFIVCQDLDENCYEAFEIDVPCELFASAQN